MLSTVNETCFLHRMQSFMLSCSFSINCSNQAVLDESLQLELHFDLNVNQILRQVCCCDYFPLLDSSLIICCLCCGHFIRQKKCLNFRLACLSHEEMNPPKALHLFQHGLFLVTLLTETTALLTKCQESRGER